MAPGAAQTPLCHEMVPYRGLSGILTSFCTGAGMDAGHGWIGRSEALKRLGVKTQTLYAYVSRGRIAARPDPTDPRRSLYAESDIERLEAGDRAAPPAVLSRGAAGRGEGNAPGGDALGDHASKGEAGAVGVDIDKPGARMAV